MQFTNLSKCSSFFRRQLAMQEKNLSLRKKHIIEEFGEVDTDF